MLAFSNIVFDCCQRWFQGQDTAKSIEIQLQHGVHGYTALECGKNVNLCLSIIVLVQNLERE